MGSIFRIVISVVIFVGWVSASQAAWIKDKLKVEPAVGLGYSSLDMAVKTNGEDLRYNHTNSGFYFLNVGVEDVSVQIKFPIKDTQESRNTRGDTRVTDYQFGFGFQKNWHTEFYYQKYQGYYIESQKVQLIQPELSFSHVGGQLTYVFDPEYSFAMTRETGWQQSSSKGSWLLTGGYDEFNLDGDLVPSSLNSGLRSNMENAKAKAISARISRGHNWIWDRWFGGVLCGGGLNYSQIHYQYATMDSSSSDMKIIANFSMSGGYRWGQSKVGMFVRVQNWNLAFDDKEITSSVGTSGFYYSKYF